MPWPRTAAQRSRMDPENEQTPRRAERDGASGTASVWAGGLGGLAQRGEVVHVLQPVEGRGLEALCLAGADAQLALHLGARAGLAGRPEAQLDDLALVLGQALERFRDRLGDHRLVHFLLGRRGLAGLQVAEGGRVVVVA